MKTSMRLAVILGLIFLLTPTCPAFDAVYLNRIVSTQKTVIVSIDASGIMVWSNSVPGAICHIEHSTDARHWSEYFPTNGIQTNGPYSSAWVPSIGRGTNYYRYIVGFQPTVTLEEVGAIFAAEGLEWKVIWWDDTMHATVADIPAESNALADLEANPAVQYVELDQVIHVCTATTKRTSREIQLAEAPPRFSGL